MNNGNREALARAQNQGGMIQAPALPTEWEMMRVQANELLQSGFLPKSIRTPEQAIAIMQTGKELGLGPMQSLRGIHVIDGKPAMSADLIAGLALARVPGSTLRVVESTNVVCRVEAARSGHDVTPFSFSMDDAKNAGLTGKPVWRQYPRAMLRARCLTEACRAVFPDVVMGLYSPEELEDSSGGQSIDVQPFRDEGPSLSLSPHAHPDEDPDAPAKPNDDFGKLMDALLVMDRDAFDPGCSWGTAMGHRGVLGSKGKPTPFSKRLSELYQSEALSPGQRRELSARWNRVDRKLTVLIGADGTGGQLKAPAIEASFVDGEREPGSDDE